MNSFAYNTTGDTLLEAAAALLTGQSLHISEAHQEDIYSQKMIKNQLQTIVRNANNCLMMIDAGRMFPEWAQSEIAVAEDGLVSVTEYMQSHYSDEVKLSKDVELEEAFVSAAEKNILDSIIMDLNNSQKLLSTRTTLVKRIIDEMGGTPEDKKVFEIVYDKIDSVIDTLDKIKKQIS